MIYLTADVHCRIPNYWEQEKGGNELDACIEYLNILKKYGLSCTVFINGKCLVEEPEKVKKILSYDIELGGHTYDNFGRMNVFKSYFNRKRYGCVYGSYRYQEKDILKTKMSFEVFGLKLQSWRTHAFASNEDTYGLLAQNGIMHVSDLFNEKPFEKKYDDKTLVHMPINIPVDVTTVAYGYFKPENRDPFASCVKGRIEPEEWFEILKKRVRNNEIKNPRAKATRYFLSLQKEKLALKGEVLDLFGAIKKIDSILLIHPITMKVMDNFELFEKIAKFLSQYESKKIHEVNFQGGV